MSETMPNVRPAITPLELLIECVDHAEADPGFAPTPDWALKIAEDFVRQIPADLPTHIVIANLAFHYVVGVFERHYNSTP